MNTKQLPVSAVALEAWLRSNETSAAKFAEKVEVSPRMMQLYLKGSVPKAVALFAIEDATGGAVTARGWVQTMHFTVTDRRRR